MKPTHLTIMASMTYKDFYYFPHVFIIYVDIYRILDSRYVELINETKKNIFTLLSVNRVYIRQSLLNYCYCFIHKFLFEEPAEAKDE